MCLVTHSEDERRTRRNTRNSVFSSGGGTGSATNTRHIFVSSVRSCSFLRQFSNGSFLLFFTILCHVTAVAGSMRAGAPPTVTLDKATVTGVASSTGTTNHFLGIPFARPPTGDLRFRLPQSLPPYNTSFSATAYGPACPQQPPELPLPPGLLAETINYLTNSIFDAVIPSAEDCLTLNVITPASATPASKLPVVVWIFPGGFELGGTAIFDGTVIVERAISLGVPALYVSMNYRLNAFGFLASQEVKDAGVGNLGLQDQRLALRWIQKYISAFGGDPTKVTIWGQSAGAISVALHMVTNGGNSDGLFRAAFMQSGSPIAVGDITHGQPYYDALSAATGCASPADTLQCLREVPYETLMNAVYQTPGVFSYQSLALAWLPRVDGVFLTEDPQRLVQQGSVANIPFISGDCDDEGTAFSLATLNITTDSQFKEYLSMYWMPNASSTELAQLMIHYPSDPLQGSPFGTGDRCALTPQFKRLAAFQGDAVFQAPRRFFIQNQSGKQSIWTYLSKRLKEIPILGSFHASDVLTMYLGGDMTSYLVRFVTHLDPNVGQSTDLYWPQYDATTGQTMLVFSDGFTPQSLAADTYREEAMAFLTNMSLANPF